MNKMKLINDPVYGLIPIRSALIYDLIEHPLFQRLRRIKQTGLTHLVYPGAQHTRFHHALGAMHLMATVITDLRAKSVEISAEEEEAAMAAVLLHDIGHSPYSHALERLIIDAPHEMIGMVIMKYLARSLGPSLLMAHDMFTGVYPRPFFHELISGQLDLDRLDYLSRDSFYTGVAEGVVGHDRIVRMLNVVDDHLVVEEKGLYSIEKFLMARRIMYWQVYLHKTVLAAELMSQGLIGMIRELTPADRQTFLSPELHFFLNRDVQLEDFESDDDLFWQHFQNLDDVSVDYSFKRLQEHDDPAIRYLTRSLMGRHLHKVIFSENPLTEKILADILENVRKHHHWSESMADKLIWTGSEANTMYKPDEEEIRILTKQQGILPYSAFLNASAQIAFHHKYYVCFPRAN